jgi:predicted CDP-diglyceride synthetase/phosphatidate cytidylyltransferase
MKQQHPMANLYGVINKYYLFTEVYSLFSSFINVFNRLILTRLMPSQDRKYRPRFLDISITFWDTSYHEELSQLTMDEKRSIAQPVSL